ncbi:MAG: sulfotransferase family 2 domain-containing protein [Alphaproteobacteria bacterium]
MDSLPAPRLLRHTPGTIENLSANAAHRFAAQHALVHYASGAVFTFIPKNACTSLRVSLALANGVIADPADWGWVHQNNTTFSATLSELARASRTAVVLRCPFSRLVSTFLDKIVSRDREFWALHRLSRDTIDPDTLTFRQFVDWIGRPGFFRADIHWRPQVDFLVYAHYDDVFSMADLTGFATCFSASTGQAFVDARPLSGHATSSYAASQGGCHADTPLLTLLLDKSKGLLPRPQDLYDAPLIAQVRRLYAKDLELYLDLIGPKGLLFPQAEDLA